MQSKKKTDAELLAEEMASFMHKTPEHIEKMASAREHIIKSASLFQDVYDFTKIEKAKSILTLLNKLIEKIK